MESSDPSNFTYPSHAVCEACGREAHLGVLEALADLPEHRPRPHPQALEGQVRVPPVKDESMVSSTRTVRMAGSSMGARNMDAPVWAPDASSVCAMMIVNRAPSAPVISHFSPSMT